MDWSKFSDDDLLALKAGDLSRVSDQGLALLKDNTHPQETYDTTEGMSSLDLALAGAGKAIVDTGRGLGQLVGLVDESDIEEARKRDAALMDTSAGMTGNVLGNVAMALLPGGGLKAASIVANAGKWSKLTNALSKAGGALLAPKTVKGAAAVGAGTGLIQPSVSTEETIGNMALGGGAGALTPVVAKGVNAGKAMIEPFYESGRDKILGRALASAAGNQADDVVNNLKSATPLVPDSHPTAAEVAQNPGIAALQRAAISVDPVVTNELTIRQAANNQARLDALEGLVPDRSASIAAREVATKPLYEAASSARIEVTPALRTLFERPSMQSALKRAEQLAKENGEVFDLENLTGSGAQYIKMALDDISNAGPATGIGGNEIRAVKATRAAYLKELEQQVPEYLQANREYANFSRPVTQADLVEELTGRGKDFRGNLTPAAFSRALDDKTAQRVTGQAGVKLDDVFEPEQLDTLEAIKQDLLNADFANTAGRSVGSNTVQNLAYANMLDQAGVPTMLRSFAPIGVLGNVASKVGDVGYKRANHQLASRLAEALLNPTDTARLMQAAEVSPGVKRIFDALTRGGAGVGVATPYLLNTGKE